VDALYERKRRRLGRNYSQKRVEQESPRKAYNLKKGREKRVDSTRGGLLIRRSCQKRRETKAYKERGIRRRGTRGKIHKA